MSFGLVSAVMPVTWGWSLFRSPALVHDQADRGIAAQSFGIGAGLVRFIHEALSLGFIEARDLRVELDREAEAAVVIFNQTDQRPHRRILDRQVELFGGADLGAVVTGGIRCRKEQFGIGTAFLEAFLQGISQGNIQQSAHGLDCSRTPAVGNRLGGKQGFHRHHARQRSGAFLWGVVLPLRRRLLPNSRKTAAGIWNLELREAGKRTSRESPAVAPAEAMARRSAEGAKGNGGLAARRREGTQKTAGEAGGRTAAFVASLRGRDGRRRPSGRNGGTGRIRKVVTVWKSKRQA